MKYKNRFLVLIFSCVISSGAAFCQLSQQNVDYLESIPTESSADRNIPEVPENVIFKLDAIYGNVDGRNLTADIFTPKVTPEKSRPAVVFLHGGGWRAGGPQGFHYQSSYLASRHGVFAMSVDYRLSGEAPFPAALQDAKCAIRWIRSKADELNIDPERIVISGGSAGAHLSSMILTTAGIPEYEGEGGNENFSSNANLGVFFCGVFDMWDMLSKGSAVSQMEQFMDGKPEEIPGRYTELSSVYRIHKYIPPVLLLHGLADEAVSHDQSIAFYNRVNAVGGYAEITLYDEMPHGWFNREPTRTITLERMERFIVEQFNLSPVEEW